MKLNIEKETVNFKVVLRSLTIPETPTKMLILSYLGFAKTDSKTTPFRMHITQSFAGALEGLLSTVVIAATCHNHHVSNSNPSFNIVSTARFRKTLINPTYMNLYASTKTQRMFFKPA